MDKGISPVVAVVMMIAIAVIMGVGLYYWLGGVTPGPEPVQPTSITVRPVSPENSRFLVTNVGPYSITLSSLSTTESGVECSFNGTVTIDAGKSKSCYMPPKAGSVSIYGTDRNGRGVTPFTLSLSFNDVPYCSFFANISEIGGGGSESEDWWNTSWSYRKPITVEHELVECSLSDFPILIRLDTDAGLSAHAQADGDDIVFVSFDNTTKLNHEIERYNDGTGELFAWVAIPSLSSVSDTTIWMYYGNGACGSQQNVSGVWDSDFLMVQHLSETSSTHYDSIGNANSTAIDVSAQGSATGQVDGCDDFESSSTDEVVLTDSTAFDIADNFSVEFWMKLDNDFNNTIAETMPIIGKYEDANNMMLVALQGTDNTQPSGNDGKMYFKFEEKTTAPNTAFYYAYTTTNSWTAGTWYHILAVHKDVPPYNGYVYVNGILEGTATSNGNGNMDLSQVDAPVELGRCTIEQESGAPVNYFDGLIDEVRISNVVRSGCYTNTTHNTISNSSFISAGTAEEYSSGSPTLNWADSNCDYRLKISIDNSASSEALVNFPHMIKFDSDDITYSRTGSTDIRFYDANNSTLLSKETELWNASGDSYIWVKVPQVNTGSNDYVWAYYNCTDTNNDSANSVWDANYLMVQHLQEGAGTLYDSTSNGINGTDSGGITYATTGTVDGAAGFDGSNDYINLGANKFDVPAVTVCAWVKSHPTGSSTDGRIVTTGTENTNKWTLTMTSTYQYIAFSNSAASHAVPRSDSQLNDDQWHFVCGKSDPYELWVDGANQTGSLTDSWSFEANAKIGSRGTSHRFNGTIDEVRVSDVARSGSWINASYLSMTDSMNSFGSETQYSASTVATLTYTANDPDGLLWVALKEDGSTVANNTVDNCNTFYTHDYSSYSAESTYVVWYRDCDGNTVSKTYS